MGARVYGLIPARLASTRLPRKLLLSGTGKPLIQHTWETARQSRFLADVVVAADSEEIASAVRKFGGRCELTGDHPSGTDRIAEVVGRSFADADIIVNIQGDEPEIDPAALDLLVGLLLDRPDSQMATLATPIRTRDVRDSPSCVKVVCAADGRALYFSRSLIPFCRDETPDSLLAGDTPWLLHVGLYAYRREFLMNLTKLPVSRLERLEKLEQLRALEAGATIRVGIIERSAVGIDTPEDYARFVARQRGDETPPEPGMQTWPPIINLP
ncbi:MAG: 3-deoxy-manno-octulosonate cytidylyltransferase [Planctomycetia bacterium]|nr:3-deoxy-manno-octulosonate cytidylyltransferase [Planctomycetia bacterium]